MLLPPNGATVTGHAEIQARYRQIFSTTKLRLENRTAELHVSGHWAYIRGVTLGEALRVDGGAPTEINDKYLMILRRQEDASWKIARLVWSKNLPQLELMR